ncbi:MAG: alpha/beta hydrolase [Dehalococcoidia bacterium]|nr:alpha/beta hydrolase [Dehalococcoidia bacterium]
MKESWQDFEFLDHSALAGFIFYPRPDQYISPDMDHSAYFDLPVEEGISISCRFYHGDKTNPNILYFHGNGELASEYEDVGEVFNRAGINLFVADYRGYGRSGGAPSISSMMRDAHGVLKGFKSVIDERGLEGSCFIMGRSLGSASAIELASNHPGDFKGLIIESGFCDVNDLMGRLGLSPPKRESTNSETPGLDRVRQITLPALVIHGKYDSIVPSAEGEKIFRNLKSADKKMVMIPHADHNSILVVGLDLYMRELTAFIQRNK